jgi:hypothetical protein
MSPAPPWRRKERPTRERFGHEQPGSVLRGPPITISCQCGEKRELRYGQSWTCERCGRRWNTARIPAEQYAAIRGTQLRFRVLPVVYGLLVAGAALFFLLTGNIFSMFILLPVGTMAWFFFIQPVHRRRYRRAIAALPRWKLGPE